MTDEREQADIDLLIEHSTLITGTPEPKPKPVTQPHVDLGHVTIVRSSGRQPQPHQPFFHPATPGERITLLIVSILCILASTTFQGDGATLMMGIGMIGVCYALVGK